MGLNGYFLEKLIYWGLQAGIWMGLDEYELGWRFTRKITCKHSLRVPGWQAI
jgi:hypothetical protein